VAEAGAPASFTGLEGRGCGEHRTTGSRAWCFDDGEWCYPEAPCRGCELPGLRQKLGAAEAEVARLEREQLATKLHLRRSHGCSGGAPDHDAPAWRRQLDELEAQVAALTQEVGSLRELNEPYLRSGPRILAVMRERDAAVASLERHLARENTPGGGGLPGPGLGGQAWR
jgi:hypothetical protein